jgi:hypothetical protein
MTTFSEWNNFYIIVGSSAGALIGLQFVIIIRVGAQHPADEGAPLLDQLPQHALRLKR